jgi:hypothetical protein
LVREFETGSADVTDAATAGRDRSGSATAVSRSTDDPAVPFWTGAESVLEPVSGDASASARFPKNACQSFPKAIAVNPRLVGRTQGRRA